MKYRYEVTADAQCDLVEIEAYVGSYADNDTVDAVSDAFESAFERLCENPFLHAIYQFPDGYAPMRTYRSVNVYNYKVFYRVDEARGVILIYRICHLASDFTRTGM